MVDAVIFRCSRPMPDGPDRIWFEYAPLVNGKPKRRPTHMMGSVASAVDLARRSGFSAGSVALNLRV